MNDNIAKMVSTVSVWTATAFIFVFGVFRFEAAGVGGFLWCMLALGLVWAPVAATQAIWRDKPEGKRNDRTAQAGAEPSAVTQKV